MGGLRGHGLVGRDHRDLLCPVDPEHVARAGLHDHELLIDLWPPGRQAQARPRVDGHEQGPLEVEEAGDLRRRVWQRRQGRHADDALDRVRGQREAPVAQAQHEELLGRSLARAIVSSVGA